MNTADEQPEVRSLATKLFLAEHPHRFTSAEEHFQHHDVCRAMQMWFPYEGVNKAGYKYMPSPKHTEQDGTCAACLFDAWVRCWRKASATLGGADTA